jgi:hypothetical protein
MLLWEIKEIAFNQSLRCRWERTKQGDYLMITFERNITKLSLMLPFIYNQILFVGYHPRVDEILLLFQWRERKITGI